MKLNADNKKDRNSKLPTVVTNLFHWKEQQKIIYEAKTRKLESFIYRRISQKKL